MELVVFDLDGTLIDADSSALWNRYLWKNKITTNPYFLELEKEGYERYLDQSLNIFEHLPKVMDAISHLSEEEIDELTNDYAKEIIPYYVFPEAKSVIEKYREQGVRMIIITASSSFFVNKIARLLDIEIIGLDLEKICGRYYVKGMPSFREGKVERLNKWMSKNNIKPSKIIFYTDSINDVFLCERSDEVYAVNADEELNNICRQKGWKILKWKREKSRELGLF